MGQLVFQATLGGQVNLVGPNTASTFNINVPAVAGNMVTTGDTGTVTNTMLASSAYTAPGTIGSGTPNTGAFTTLTASTSMRSPIVGAGSGSNLSLQSNATTQATLDTAGNLGLGVTPSAWVSSVRALDVGSGGGFVYAGDFTVAYNAYTNGANWIYKTTNGAARYTQGTSGQHVWYSAASGTAGNAITFTQAMTLDASGNLIIGGTTAYGKATVSGTLPFFRVVDTAGSSGVWGSYISGSSTDLAAFTYSSVTGENRIGGLQSYVFPTFYSGGSERARIDSSGNLLVGTTSGVGSGNNEFRASVSAGGTAVLVAYNSNSADSATAFNAVKASTTTSSSQRFIQFYANAGATAMGGIVGNGASNVQFAALSDAREKTNIQNISGSLEKINALRPVEFDWIADNTHVNAGFIAQEVEPIFPEFVIENIANEGQEERKGLTGGMTGGIIPHLVKAIQEQQALITQLQADVAALKA